MIFPISANPVAKLKSQGSQISTGEETQVEFLNSLKNIYLNIQC